MFVYDELTKSFSKKKKLTKFQQKSVAKVVKGGVDPVIKIKGGKKIHMSELKSTPKAKPGTYLPVLYKKPETAVAVYKKPQTGVVLYKKPETGVAVVPKTSNLPTVHVPNNKIKITLPGEEVHKPKFKIPVTPGKIMVGPRADGQIPPQYRVKPKYKMNDTLESIAERNRNKQAEPVATVVEKGPLKIKVPGKTHAHNYKEVNFDPSKLVVDRTHKKPGKLAVGGSTAAVHGATLGIGYGLGRKLSGSRGITEDMTSEERKRAIRTGKIKGTVAGVLGGMATHYAGSKVGGKYGAKFVNPLVGAVEGGAAGYLGATHSLNKNH